MTMKTRQLLNRNAEHDLNVQIFFEDHVTERDFTVAATEGKLETI